MTRLLAPAVLAAAGLAGAAAAPTDRVEPRTTSVMLDAVVLDEGGHPARGLRADDFDVREDGQRVAVDHVSAIDAVGLPDDPAGRSMVLLLDDTLVGAIQTTVVRGIAQRFLSRAQSADAVAVVRLTHRTDAARGSIEDAVERVAAYHAKSLPFFGIESIEDLLDTVARIARTIGTTPARRTAVVCIGGRTICDPYFERPELTLARRSWHDAIVETARANVAVYFVDPLGVRAGGIDLGYGLVQYTGGAAFVNSNSFDRAVDAIWEQTGHYYLLGYHPTSRPRTEHSIRIKTTRRGLHVLARLARGD